MTTHSEKLFYLLQLLWQSPVFGDSFPKNLNKGLVLEQLREIQAVFPNMLFPILQAGMPEANPVIVREVIAQIAPKSIAFCAAIPAGEVKEIQPLLCAAGEVAIIYWADQGMDRGDSWMVAAVKYLNHQSPSDDILASHLFQTRFNTLNHIQALAQQITAFPEDQAGILKALQNDILKNEARLYTLSQEFLQDSSAFWEQQACEVAQVMIDCSGLMSAGTTIYASYRHNQPQLPSLQEIYSQPDLMRLVQETLNPAVRVFDDIGDCFVDAGQNPSWGVFNLNIVNQNHPLLIEHFLRLSGISPEQPLYRQAIEVFALPLAERRRELAHFYLDLCRQRITELPTFLWQRYGIFITLSKRILEATFVNILGDVFLAEHTPSSVLESNLLNLIQEAIP